MRKLLIITAAITLSFNCAFAQDLVLSDVLEQARTVELGQTQAAEETTKTQDKMLTPVKNKETINTNTDASIQEANTKPVAEETTVPTQNTTKVKKGQKLPTTTEKPLTQTNQVTTPDNTVEEIN